MFFSYEELDRTLFEHIRLKVVELNYLPDIALYTTQNAYKTAKDTLRASLPDKQLIEVYGVGAAENRDEKTVSKIVIDRKSAPRGSLGGWPATFFEERTVGSSVVYDKKMYPDQTRNVRYEIRYITNTAKYARILSEIIDYALGTKKFLNSVNPSTLAIDPDKCFYMLLQNEVDVSSNELMEYVFTYEIQDIFLKRLIDIAPSNPTGEGRPILSNIVPLTTVSYYLVPVASNVDLNSPPAQPTASDGNFVDVDYNV